MFAYMERYSMGLHLKEDELAQMRGHRAKPYDTRITAENAHMQDEDGFDLISKLLVCDHARRLTATEALAHPYFDAVRNAV